MSSGDPEIDKQLDSLLEKLEGLNRKSLKDELEPVVLKGKGPHFYWSLNDRMFLEISSGVDLFIMTNRGEKEGKYYIFSPWRWSMGCIFLIPKEKIVKLGYN
jgi:hypothetical protein